jgi:hypothetical protein
MITTYRTVQHGRTGRRMATLAAALVLFLVVGVPTTVAETKSVSGTFTSVRPETCESPVGFCTDGRLTGDLVGDYDFVMDKLQPHPTDPTLLVYEGHSVITLDRGGAQLRGQDTGWMRPAGTSAVFETTVRIVGGTKQYEGACGQIVAAGTLDFATGNAEGTYTGAITKEEDAQGWPAPCD